MRRQCVLRGPVMAALMLVASVSLARPQQSPRLPSQPASVVLAFYKQHMATDKGFTEQSLRAKRKWLTPELYALLLYERRRPVPNGDVPYIDGDPFTDSQDGPDRWGIKGATQKGTDARVDVYFDWLNAGKVTEHRVCHVNMARLAGQWRIADIVAPEGRSLRAEMKGLKRQDMAAKPKRGKGPKAAR